MITPACEFIYAQSRLISDGHHIDYLEIGVQEGNSLDAALKNEDVRLAVGIDTWGEDSGGTGRGSPDYVASRFGDLHRVILITSDSHHILGGMRHSFDMIFIDGDHSQDGCLADLAGCKSLLNRHSPRGRIFVDDLDHPKHSYLHETVEKWAAENGFTFKFHPIGYGIGELGIKREETAQATS